MPPADVDTIAAIATPPGEGAIAIVRMSGPQALQIADLAFRGDRRLADVPGYTVHYGGLIEPGGGMVDEVLATVFRQPKSFTGEDSVEFSCHGGILVTRAVLDAVLEFGARQAEPGEFSRRAFLNGRIDLSQAEAVADLIAAQSGRGRAASLEQLTGKLGGRVKELRSRLTDLCSLLEIDLDFAEEGLDLIGDDEIERRVNEINSSLEEMARSYESGKLAREGVTVVLAGKPNAGKSSLFNAFLKESRAIVTPVPGTTRDYLEENVSIDGILFRVIDTAGIRPSVDLIEVEGIDRSWRSVRMADMIILVIDSTSAFGRDDVVGFLDELDDSQHLIVALNKSDLSPSLKAEALLPAHVRVPCVAVSALTGEGVEELEQKMLESVADRKSDMVAGGAVTSRRHLDAINRGTRSLSGALRALRSHATYDLLAFDIRESIAALGEITGEVTTEDILNNIFSKFCIGK